MNLLEESRSILEKSGYRTLLETNTAGVCHFEDATVLGAVFVHNSVDEMLERWEASQDRFLGNNSSVLRNAPVKVWNIYTIHLTTDELNGTPAEHPFDIEQDFRGTRKIVRTGIKSRADLKDALLPLLAVQHQIVMSPKRITERLKERLLATSEVLAGLLEDVPEDEIANELEAGK